jgi:hypothetical protein
MSQMIPTPHLHIKTFKAGGLCLYLETTLLGENIPSGQSHSAQIRVGKSERDWSSQDIVL